MKPTYKLGARGAYDCPAWVCDNITSNVYGVFYCWMFVHRINVTVHMSALCVCECVSVFLCVCECEWVSKQVWMYAWVNGCMSEWRVWYKILKNRNLLQSIKIKQYCFVHLWPTEVGIISVHILKWTGGRVWTTTYKSGNTAQTNIPAVS